MFKSIKRAIAKLKLDRAINVYSDLSCELEFEVKPIGYKTFTVEKRRLGNIVTYNGHNLFSSHTFKETLIDGGWIEPFLKQLKRMTKDQKKENTQAANDLMEDIKE